MGVHPLKYTRGRKKERNSKERRLTQSAPKANLSARRLFHHQQRRHQSVNALTSSPHIHPTKLRATRTARAESIRIFRRTHQIQHFDGVPVVALTHCLLLVVPERFHEAYSTH